MISDENLISMMVSEPSWEDVIIKIVAEDGMDPWAVDMVRLSDTFSSYVEKMEQHDLRVPARFILIAAILVRMKSDIFIERKDNTRVVDPSKSDAELIEMLSQVPPLSPPVKRFPVGNVTVEELVSALNKAFDVKERREHRHRRARRAVERALPDVEAEDITVRIDNLKRKIDDVLKEIEGSIEFSKLVQEWKRENIVKTLMPMLHLSQDGKIVYDQPELFNEIYVSKNVNVNVNNLDKEVINNEQTSAA